MEKYTKSGVKIPEGVIVVEALPQREKSMLDAPFFQEKMRNATERLKKTGVPKMEDLFPKP
ncbi:MAG TPA: hypothetical protein VFE50_22690 [Cyclobacteriaceae bacterium]|nr:hypothetical protein [Cyclobacteriaceae bacterium]